MLDQYEEFRKIQLECSNVFLIDENFCVGQSYQIINNNLISLSTRLASFSTSINYFNNLFTHFAQNSSKYEEMNKNLEDFTDKFNSIYTYTKNTSSEWTRPICFYYPQQFEVQYWKNNNATIKTTTLQTWLNLNHPPRNFTINQQLYLFVNLYEDRQFRLDKFFRKEFYETCPMPPVTININCGSNPCGHPGAGCNVKKGFLGLGGKDCFNPYTRCGRSVTGGGNISVSCPTGGQKNLIVTDTRNAVDRFLCTSLGLKYVLSNNTWIYSNEI